MALTKVTYSMIDGVNAVNVKDFGADSTGATFSDAAFNLAIAQANSTSTFLYIPPGQYKTQTTLTTITGPGILGSVGGNPVIRHYSPNDLFIVYGAYKKVVGIRLLNMTAAGAGTVNGALLKLRNCWYGYFQDIYAAHDLDDYSGICFEQNYDGSVDDAYFLVHGGVWYNTAINLSALYNVFGSARGYGVTLRVNANALGVVNPPGEPAGTYSGSVGNNQLIGCNIEGKLNGLRMDNCANNIIMGGQFLGCTIQVRVINGRQNQFLQTKHNQWTTAPFQIDGASSGRNFINYPTLFATTATPWSLGTLTATDNVRHIGEGMVNNQAFFSTVSIANELTISALIASGFVPTLTLSGDNNDAATHLAKLTYGGNTVTLGVYSESTGALTRTLLEQGNGATTGSPLWLRPGVDNYFSLGTASRRWTEVFAANGTINTSDEREKQQIQEIDDAVLRAWSKVNFVQFKFNDAVQKKGDKARIHFGVIAQKVKEAFESEGLDGFDYGILCYDEWLEEVIEHPAQLAKDAILDKDGNVISPALPDQAAWTETRPSGNRYGIRYEEALALECAYLRSKLNA
jgi:hypothetical protein